jgi:MFS family permease
MLIPGLFMAGLGIGCVIGPLFAISLGEVDPHHAGAGSGVLEAVEQLGGAIGVVVIGGVFFAQLESGEQNTFQHAYVICVLCEVFLLVLLTALSFTLPRTIRDEDELKKELGIEK